MKITILSLFPEMFEGFLSTSIIKRAIENNLVDISIVDFRKYTNDKHLKVDDYPYGGSQGMILTVQPIADAIKDHKNTNSKVYLLTPEGITFNQKTARTLIDENNDLILICGHYEGFDARIENYIDGKISIGDYILTGGEIPAMAITDAITRLIPGVIKDDSNLDESFENDLLEPPQYTKPREYDGYCVPEVLFSGDHARVKRYQLEQSIKRTYQLRKDLIDKHQFTKEEKEILEKVKIIEENTSR